MDLIKEPNPSFDKQLFLKSLHEHDEPVEFKVLKLGNIYKSRQNGKPNFYVEMEILTDFDCKIMELDLVGYPQEDDDGNKITKTVNVINQVVGLPFELKPARERGKYIISNKTNLFPIVNYAFIDKGIVPEGNQQGFNNVTFDELREALTGLFFWGKVVLVEKTTLKPYFKLVPIENEYIQQL